MLLEFSVLFPAEIFWSSVGLSQAVSLLSTLNQAMIFNTVYYNFSFLILTKSYVS